MITFFVALALLPVGYSACGKRPVLTAPPFWRPVRADVNTEMTGQTG